MKTNRTSKKGVKATPQQNPTTAQPEAGVEKKDTGAEITPVENLTIAQPEKEVDFSNLFFITEKGNLLPIKQEFGHNGTKPVLEDFKSAEELPNLILNNRQAIFGQSTFLINEQKEKSLASLGILAFDGILFDFGDVLKPKLYLVVVLQKNLNLAEFFFRMTHFFAFIRNAESPKKFIEVLDYAIIKNEALKKEMKEKTGDREITELLGEMLKRKPNVLMIMDSIREELQDLVETYTETWGELVKTIIIRKFSSNGDTLITIEPAFDGIRNGKKKKADKVIRTTEESHFEGASLSVKEVYDKIKVEMLAEDSTLLFNPKQYYISMKKNRNLAFFHVGKKRITMVVMNPEDETRKLIRHHEVKTLTEKVQKFWNGPSCAIVLEDRNNLNEVINLLKKLIKE